MQMRMLGEKTSYIFFYKKSCRGVLAFHFEVFFNSCLMPFFAFCILCVYFLVDCAQWGHHLFKIKFEFLQPKSLARH